MTNWDKVRPEDFARFIKETMECYMCGVSFRLKCGEGEK